MKIKFLFVLLLSSLFIFFLTCNANIDDIVVEVKSFSNVMDSTNTYYKIVYVDIAVYNYGRGYAKSIEVSFDINESNGSWTSSRGGWKKIKNMDLGPGDIFETSVRLYNNSDQSFYATDVSVDWVGFTDN